MNKYFKFLGGGEEQIARLRSDGGQMLPFPRGHHEEGLHRLLHQQRQGGVATREIRDNQGCAAGAPERGGDPPGTGVLLQHGIHPHQASATDTQVPTAA